MNLQDIRVTAIAASLLLLGAAVASPAPVSEPRMVFHLAQASSGPASCAVPITACSEARTFGIVSGGSEQNYFGYILITGFDRERGLERAQFAVDFNRTTGAGVDTYDWTLCASRAANTSDWYNSLEGNTLYWDDCPKGEFAMAGYFYMAAYDPSRMGIVPPQGADARIKTCGGDELVVPPTRLGIASFTGDTGCNPCTAECHYVAVEPGSWSGLKALYGGAAGQR